MKTRITTKSTAPATKKSSRKTARKTEFFTAEEIQREWRRENGSRRAKSPKSAIVSQRAKRDARRGAPTDVSRQRGGKIDVVTAKKLAAIPWLVHGFSTRRGGVTEEYGGKQLNLGYTPEDSREAVERNRELFFKALGAVSSRRPWPLVNLSQIHSGLIHRVGQDLQVPHKGDGLITNIPGVLIAVKVADCLPVIVVDRKKKAIGVFHAGWRGTVKRIVEKGVGDMRLNFGSDPKDLVAAIGPSIGNCCYEIGDEVESEFESQFTYWSELFEDVWDSYSLHVKYPLLFLNQRAPGHGQAALSRHLNLLKANLLQLRAAGIPEKNIEPLNLCTSCDTNRFFSYRKDRVTGRMMAVAGIRTDSK